MRGGADFGAPLLAELPILPDHRRRSTNWRLTAATTSASATHLATWFGVVLGLGLTGVVGDGRGGKRNDRAAAATPRRSEVL
jgi:hypothetical protein